MNRSVHHRGGFTIVELLVSTLLAAMLMTAIMGLAASASRSREFMDKADTEPAWSTRLIELLRWDLQNATTVRISGKTVSIEGFGYLSPIDGSAGHRRVGVTYLIETDDDDRSVLVRKQVQHDSTTNKNTRIDLMCIDVVDFAVSIIKDNNGDAPQRNKNKKPSRVTVRIKAGKMSRPLEKVLVLN